MIMPKTPKQDGSEENDLADEADTWEEDQKQHEYYYDDAHGYEVYQDDEAEDDQHQRGLK